jgi:hypothetical protein
VFTRIIIRFTAGADNVTPSLADQLGIQPSWRNAHKRTSVETQPNRKTETLS